MAQGGVREGIPIATYVCPSRRSVRSYPNAMAPWHGFYCNINYPSTISHTDYAANTGDGTSLFPGYPGMGEETGQPGNAGHLTGCTGVIFELSQVKLADISDGSTHTLLAGDKYLNPDDYESGLAGNDDQSPFVGPDHDIQRYTNPATPPLQDIPGYAGTTYEFGSAHPGAFQAVFCDGSVHGLSYDIDAPTFQYLGHRKDGHVIGANSY